MSMPVVDVGAKVARLRDELEQYRRRRAGWRRRSVSTGLAPLDAALPDGGLPCGAVTEILCETPGTGAMSLALRVARRCLGSETEVRSSKFEVQREATKPRSHEATEGEGTEGRRMTGNADHSAFRIPHSAFDIRHSTFAIFDSPFDVSGNAGRAIVFVDSDADFYPPAAWDQGIPFDRLVVIRPRNEREAYEAADEALRCSAVAAVIVSLRGLNDRLARRLQLAAESSGGLGVLLRPVRRPTHRFAAVQMRLEGVPPSGDRPHARLCRITLLTVREGTPAEPFLVDLDHETGAGVVSALPGHAAAARTG